MFAFGMLAVFQVLLLPGLLLIKSLPSKRSFIANAAYIVALSMLANYVAVLILTALKIYIRPVVLVIFALEMLLFFRLHQNLFSAPLSESFVRLFSSIASVYTALRSDFRNFFQRAAKVISEKSSKKQTDGLHQLISDLLRFSFALLAIGCILYVVYIFLSQLGTVYQTFDAWASWDPWAVDWFNNGYARNTWEYPQLIPINWSITYQFIGDSTVKFFAKGIMPVFTLMLLALIYDLGAKAKSFGYFLACAVTFFSINRFVGRYIADGYVDLPVTFFTFLAIYSLLVARRLRDKKELRQTLILGAVAAAAAAVTKQTGGYILVFYPILTYFIVLRDYKRMSAREKFVQIGLPFLISLLIVAPWYIYTVIVISQGQYSSNIQYVINDIYEGATLPQRFMAAVNSLDKYAYLFVLAVVLIPFLNNALRWIVITVLLPYSILWAFFLSYEQRNLTIAFPLLAIATAVGVQRLYERVNFKRLSGFVIPALLVGGLLLGTAAFTGERLTAQQIALQKEIGKVQLNRHLYTFFENQGELELVITDYVVINWLPGLEGTWVRETFRDYEAYQQNLIDHPTVTLVLVPESTRDARIIAEVRQNIESGFYNLIFDQAGYLLVRIPPR